MKACAQEKPPQGIKFLKYQSNSFIIIIIFNFLRNYQTFLQSMLYHFIFLPEVYRCSNCSTSSKEQDKFRFFFLVLAILVGVWDFTMVSIYISIIINDVEHFFTCLFAIYIYSLEKGLFKSFVHILLSCLLIKLKEFFIYSRYMSFVGYVLKILSSTCLFISYVF